MKAETSNLYKTIRFQSHRFDYRKGSITNKEGFEVFMEPRLKELFFILLKHKNDFISREELMAFVWRDIVVSEQSVTKAISDLRKFLTTNQFKNLKIITISKLGYKLEVNEDLKQPILKRSFKIAAYTLSFIVALIIIIRAMRYEQ